MVYITGDTHAVFTRFGTKVFPEQKEMTRDDFVIICGDFGGIWYDNAYEQYWLKWLSEKPFTILYVDGNHENFDRLYSDEFEVVDFHGGKAHKIRDNIYHLMRGYVFDLCGKKFFSFGGASSHDIQDGILEPSDYPSMSVFLDKAGCEPGDLFFLFPVSDISFRIGNQLVHSERLDCFLSGSAIHFFNAPARAELIQVPPQGVHGDPEHIEHFLHGDDLVLADILLQLLDSFGFHRPSVPQVSQNYITLFRKFT